MCLPQPGRRSGSPGLGRPPDESRCRRATSPGQLRRATTGRRRGLRADVALSRWLRRRSRCRRRPPRSADRRPPTRVRRSWSIGAAAKPEDALELCADDQLVSDLTQRPERQHVFDPIVDPGPPVDRRQRVTVLPASVRAAQLNVAELDGLIDPLDARPPGHRDPEDGPHRVVDQGALGHRWVLRPHRERHRSRG